MLEPKAGPQHGVDGLTQRPSSQRVVNPRSEHESPSYTAPWQEGGGGATVSGSWHRSTAPSSSVQYTSPMTHASVRWKEQHPHNAISVATSAVRKECTLGGHARCVPPPRSASRRGVGGQGGVTSDHVCGQGTRAAIT